MKKLYLISLLLLGYAVAAFSAHAAEWRLFDTAPLGENPHPFSVQLVQSAQPLEKSTGLTGAEAPLQGFQNMMIPMTIHQLKLSFIDIGPETDNEEVRTESYGTTPKVGVNTGLKSVDMGATGSITPPPELFSEESEWSASTFIVFFGVDLNAGPGYFQTQAFLRTPMNGAVPVATGSGLAGDVLFNTTTQGVNAIAGVKLNDRIKLEAGYGYFDQKNRDKGSSEDAWAVYAQAILSITPGFHVIPGVGQIDFDGRQEKEGAKDNFFAGAKWEINF